MSVSETGPKLVTYMLVKTSVILSDIKRKKSKQVEQHCLYLLLFSKTVHRTRNTFMREIQKYNMEIKDSELRDHSIG